MYIYNITFVVDPARTGEFEKWLGTRLAEMALAGSLVRVVAVPGDPDFAGHAASYTFQSKFATIDLAEAFGESEGETLREAYARYMGGEGISFASIVQEVSLG